MTWVICILLAIAIPLILGKPALRKKAGVTIEWLIEYWFATLIVAGILTLFVVVWLVWHSGFTVATLIPTIPSMSSWSPGSWSFESPAPEVIGTRVINNCVNLTILVLLIYLVVGERATFFTRLRHVLVSVVVLLIASALWTWHEEKVAAEERRVAAATAAAQGGIHWLATPTVNQPMESWPKASVPAGARSEFIPLPQGMKNIYVVGVEYHTDPVVTNQGVVTGFIIYNDTKTLTHDYKYAFIPK